MADQTIPRLEVAEILDNTTIVISGTGVGQLRKDEALWVVGVGPVVRSTNLPLVVPKRTVVVTMVSPAYAIARPEVVEEEVPTHATFTLPQATYRTVRKRPPLNVEEKSLAGNPGSTPIRVGDPVVRPDDVAAFVLQLAQEKTS